MTAPQCTSEPVTLNSLPFCGLTCPLLCHLYSFLLLISTYIVSVRTAPTTPTSGSAASSVIFPFLSQSRSCARLFCPAPNIRYRCGLSIVLFPLVCRNFGFSLKFVYLVVTILKNSNNFHSCCLLSPLPLFSQFTIFVSCTWNINSFCTGYDSTF